MEARGIKLLTHRNLNVMAVLLEQAGRIRSPDFDDTPTPEHINLLQMHAKIKSTDEFEEICECLRNIPQTGDGSPKPEDNMDLRKDIPDPPMTMPCTSPQEDDQISSLQAVLAELRTPWIGLNVDFCAIPSHHPIATFALRDTCMRSDLTSKFHIFTDGSYKQAFTDRQGVNHEASAAWGFVVLCEYDEPTGPKFCRIGYAADTFTEEWNAIPGPATAEALAIIAMCEYVLAIPERTPLELTCHFDATSVGFGAFGQQQTPTLHGQQQDVQHHARIMVSLIQRLSSTARPIHVKAHEGCPFNEAVDTLAGACRRGWRPPITPILRSSKLQKHNLREWAWVEIKEHPEIPDLRTMLQNHAPSGPKGWPDHTLAKLQQEPRHDRWTMQLNFATVNVGTMNYQEEAYTSVSHKARELTKQFSSAGLDFVGLQETRARESGTLRLGPYLRLISAGDRGHAGVELWVNLETFQRKTGIALNDAHDICAWKSTPRCLAVTIQSEAIALDVVVCYAPQTGRGADEVTQWWQTFEEIIRHRPTRNQMVWLGDWNCRLGAVVTDHIGDHHADLEDVGGQEMRRLCAQFDMCLPATQADFHEGESWTYLSPLGARSRIDFIAVQAAMMPGVIRSRINDSIDVMNGEADHRVVMMELQTTQMSQVFSCLKREVPYDREKARQNKKLASVDLFQQVPCCPWQMDVNAHWATMRDTVQTLACSYFPKPKRQRRQVYFSEAAWSKLCERKDLRQLHRKQQRDLDHGILAALFASWKERRSTTAAERAHVHLGRMQAALTLKMRQLKDQEFRKCKRQEWKAWVLSQAEQQLSQVNGASATELYKILQPKKMIAKSQGHLKRALPGLQPDGNLWAVGRQQVAHAWQAQFAAVENAEETTMERLLEKSQARCTPITVQELAQVPTVYQVEDALRKMSDKKAAGLDALGAELFQVSCPQTAQKNYPLMVKAALRRQTTPELTGGWLIPLYKGKGPKSHMKGFRGIMLEPVMARVFSRSWRPRLEAALQATVCPMQWGGRKGLATEAVHMQTRMWMSSAKAAKLTLSIIYVDIKSAFYAVAKQLLVGCASPEIEIPEIACKLGVPDSAREAFAANMRNTTAVFSATGSRLLEDTVASMLQDTWFAVPCGETIMKPATGSRPGDPVADQLFGLVMGHYLQTVNERLQEAGVWNTLPDTQQVAPMNLTWVDDTAFGIMTGSAEILQVTLKALAIICDTAWEFGLALSVGVSKTAVMFSYHGKGAVEVRQQNEKAFPSALPVLTEHSGVVQIPVTNQYKHLGGIVTRGGALMTEVKVRSATTLARIHPLRKLLQNQQMDQRKRQILLKSMGLSVAMVHVGTWHNMNMGEYQVWQGLIHRLYSVLQPVQNGQEYPHRDSYELARDADSPMPMELLHIARLRLFVQILTAADPLMYSAVLCNHECAGLQSWLTGLQASCVWLSEQIDGESLPDALGALATFEAWTLLEPHARFLKKKVAQAQVNHKSRIRTLCDLKAHGKRQAKLMEDLGHLLPGGTEAIITPPVQCSQCGFEAKDEASLAVHQSRKHGARIAMRRMLVDSVCRACQTQYHTRPRALQHLHAGSTKCWAWHMRAFEPLTEQQALDLDETDKKARVAHHQRGIKAMVHDQHARPATEQELQQPDMLARTSDHPHWGDPTAEELATWCQIGFLPPGQGGRQKTLRGPLQHTMKHVIADTQSYEAEILERATAWQIIAEQIPKPMSDGKKFALLLFSGHRRPGDMADWLEWQSDIVPICVDLAVDPVHGDVCQSQVWIPLIQARRVVAAHAAPPCETYSTARWLKQPDGRGPRPLRSSSHPWGLLSRTVPEVAQCELGTRLMLEALFLVLMVFCWGGCFTVEHPRGPLTNAVQWSIWYSGFIKELKRIPGVGQLTFLQGPLGRPFCKPTTLLQGRLPGLAAKLYSSYQRGWKPTQTLGGRQGRQWKTAEAKVYPVEMCRILSQSYIAFAESVSCEDDIQIPAGTCDAIHALSKKWDPYLHQCHVGMQADYNPQRVIA